MALGLLGILGLGGVGAGIAGGLGYGFGIRYGFERIFPAFQQGGTTKAVETAASDIASLLGGGATGQEETDTFLGNLPPDSTRGDDRFGSGDTAAAGGIASTIAKGGVRVTKTGRQEDIVDSCRAQHARWRSLMSRSAALTTDIKRLRLKQQQSSGKANSVASSKRAAAMSEQRRITDELNAAINNPNNQNCASTFQA